tara:strand:+ start:909 stop:1508 length:600 start_codon:yes stop_codon:yes gene_type:complete
MLRKILHLLHAKRISVFKESNKIPIFDRMNNFSLCLLIFAPLLIASCGSNEPSGDETADLNVNATEAVSETPPIAKASWDGVYFGDQSDYFLTKPSGEPMVINGKKIPVPGSAYTIAMKGLDIEVVQIAKDESMAPVSYVGNCLVGAQSETMAQLSCTCKEQSDSKYPAEPELSLAINLVNQTMVVSGNLGPEFTGIRQ